jgi:hypothetical protein
MMTKRKHPSTISACQSRTNFGRSDPLRHKFVQKNAQRPVCFVRVSSNAAGWIQKDSMLNCQQITDTLTRRAPCDEFHVSRINRLQPKTRSPAPTLLRRLLNSLIQAVNQGIDERNAGLRQCESISKQFSSVPRHTSLLSCGRDSHPTTLLPRRQRHPQLPQSPSSWSNPETSTCRTWQLPVKVASFRIARLSANVLPRMLRI